MSEQQEQDIEMLEIVLRNKQHTNVYADYEFSAIQRLLDRIRELEQQRDAALKLADLWEGQAIKYPLENATSLVSPYTAEAVAVGQAAVRACANELRAIFAQKEQA